MKNKTFLDSIKCASKGLWYAVRTEKNFMYYIFIFSLFLILNYVFNTHYLSYISIVLFTTGVFSTECINTSIEHFVNMVDKEIKEEIRIIKDIAAGAVWVWGIGFFVSEFFWIIMAILGVLN